MSDPSVLPRFDGLMTLAKRDGVDIRPTLLRVLTDLFIQSPLHSRQEEVQFAELACRLIDEVDDATRATIRTRLLAYPRTPLAVLKKLAQGEGSSAAGNTASQSTTAASAAATSDPTGTAMMTIDDPAQPIAARDEATLALIDAFADRQADLARLRDRFFAAAAHERKALIRSLDRLPIEASPAPAASPAAYTRLEQAAMAGERDAFARDLASLLILPVTNAQRIVADDGGEALVCALKAAAMPRASVSRVLLFLNPAIGTMLGKFNALIRLHDEMEPAAARAMLTLLRGVNPARRTMQPQHRPALYDDEKHAARPQVTIHAAPGLRLTPAATKTASGE